MKKIVNPLLEWYDEHKRILPWRMDKEPYHVWVSEIMLQQTRIDAVIDYYYRFMNELPTIHALANCPQDRLLKLWEGLGYYNRVRNLQKAAQIIEKDYHGSFPNTYLEILKLPGVGEYTASAIASICFSLKEVTVDGNVLRVYMRVNNCYDNVDDLKVKKQVREKLLQILPQDSGKFNEALMELGETICLPNGMPKCEDCPLQNLCKAYKKRTYLELPIKKGKQNKKEENYTVFLLWSHNKVAISKRKDVGLLQNMWEFPNIENNITLQEAQIYLEHKDIFPIQIETSISYTHIFTHKKWNMHAYFVLLDNQIDLEDIIWVSLEDLDNIYAIPTAFQPFKKYLKERLDNYDET